MQALSLGTAPGPIPLHQLMLGEEEQQAALRVLQSGALSGNGVECAALEAASAAALGVNEVLATTSCTSSLEMAILMLGIGPGDEVIVPAWTFVTSASAVARSGAKVVFCDVDPITGNADLRHIAPLVTPKTRAVMVVHYAGRVAPLDDLLTFCQDHSLQLIEDAAHALGASDAVAAAGTRGSIGCFSLHGTKNIGCGEGGLMYVADERLRERARILREKGTNRDAWARGEAECWEWFEIGSSYVLAELLAAVATVQLSRLQAVTAARRAVAERYEQAFAGLDGVVLPPTDARASWHLYAVQVIPQQRAAIVAKMQEAGIGCAPHYLGLHRSPWARRFSPESANTQLTGVETLEAGLVRLPVHPRFSHAEQDRVIEEFCRAVQA